MKILVVSDSHMYNDVLENIIEKYINKVDLMIHCGDSSLHKDDKLLKKFNIIVKGNHDYDEFPLREKYQNIYVTHGNIQGVYNGYDKLLVECNENHCNICLHGHTHVASHTIIDQVHFINPGSTMINRGNYGFGTYAIVDVDNQEIDVHYYHSQTHELVDNIVLSDGIKTLEEFKQLVEEYNKKRL